MAEPRTRGRIQLWSYNYDPEPTGIGPVSRVAAQGLRAAGYEVRVVAAHPHYPEPRWGVARRPYREVRDGISVLRLPLWVGRASTAQRLRQEFTFMASQLAAIPALGRADAALVVSPSFPALLPAIMNMRLRRTPWVLWLHDILPDGAAHTGIVRSGAVLTAARQLERLAYREADRIVVASRPFVDNLRAKGVPSERIDVIYAPRTREPTGRSGSLDRGTFRILSMGNIGFSQDLAAMVRAFEAPDALPADFEVRLHIAGQGVAAAACAAEVRSDRVRMLGLLSSEDLEQELLSADLGFVSQHYAGVEFNIPSKLMNFMSYGLPVLAAVDPTSEVARIIKESGGGWVVDSSRPEQVPLQAAIIARDTPGRLERAEASKEYARAHFSKEAFTGRLVDVIERVRRV